MKGGLHRAESHRCAISDVEALALISDRSFPRHSHDQYGIGVVGAGAHRSWSGVGTVEAVAGDLIAVNPGEMHDGNPVQGRARSWRMLYFEPALLAETIRASAPGAVEIARPVICDPAFARLFGSLFDGITAPRPDALAVEEDMVRVLTHLVVRHGNRAPRREGPPPVVARALRRLNEAPEQAVTLSELAALSNVSRYQLLRGFARAVGTTPHAYLVQRRVLMVRRLLGAGRSLADAALEAGFSDQSHMTRAFVRQLGVTPARYRAALA